MWMKITHAKTGETQYVTSLDGIGKEWAVLALAEDRCPEPFEVVDDKGVISIDEAGKAAADEAHRVARLSRSEFMAEIVAWATEEIAKRDVQIAELAVGSSVTVTPVADIALDASQT